MHTTGKEGYEPIVQGRRLGPNDGEEPAILRKPMSVFSLPPFEPIQISIKLSLICTSEGECDL